jgi:hypothetical protein
MFGLGFVCGSRVSRLAAAASSAASWSSCMTADHEEEPKQKGFPKGVFGFYCSKKQFCMIQKSWNMTSMAFRQQVREVERSHQLARLGVDVKHMVGTVFQPIICRIRGYL